MLDGSRWPLPRRNRLWTEAASLATDLDSIYIPPGETLDSFTKFFGKGNKRANAMHDAISVSKIFGEECIVTDRSTDKAKLNPRGKKCLFVRYAKMHATGTYGLCNPATREIILSRDVAFIRSKRERSADAHAQVVKMRRAPMGDSTSPRRAVQQLDTIAEEVQGGDDAGQGNKGEGKSNADDGDGDGDNDSNSINSMHALIHDEDSSSDEEGGDISMATPYLSSGTESMEESEESIGEDDMPALIRPADQRISSSDDDFIINSRHTTRGKSTRSKRAVRLRQNTAAKKRVSKSHTLKRTYFMPLKGRNIRV